MRPSTAAIFASNSEHDLERATNLLSDWVVEEKAALWRFSLNISNWLADLETERERCLAMKRQTVK